VSCDPWPAEVGSGCRCSHSARISRSRRLSFDKASPIFCMSLQVDAPTKHSTSTMRTKRASCSIGSVRIMFTVSPARGSAYSDCLDRLQGRSDSRSASTRACARSCGRYEDTVKVSCPCSGGSNTAQHSRLFSHIESRTRKVVAHVTACVYVEISVWKQ
jgi:hypothetical protein